MFTQRAMKSDRWKICLYFVLFADHPFPPIYRSALVTLYMMLPFSRSSDDLDDVEVEVEVEVEMLDVDVGLL